MNKNERQPNALHDLGASEKFGGKKLRHWVPESIYFFYGLGFIPWQKENKLRS